VHLKVVIQKGVVWISLAEDRVEILAVLNMVKNIRVL
jgi:hypothetical protein